MCVLLPTYASPQQSRSTWLCPPICRMVVRLNPPTSNNQTGLSGGASEVILGARWVYGPVAALPPGGAYRRGTTCAKVSASRRQSYF